MLDRYYVAKVSSDDPYAPVPGKCGVVEYRFPTMRRALKFLEQSVGQGLYVTACEHIIADAEETMR